MGEYTYLPYCIVVVVLEYLAVVKATIIWTDRRDEANLRSDRVSFRVNRAPRRWLRIFDQRSFLSCSSGMYGRSSSLLLLVTRFMSFLFFVVIGMGFNWARPETHGHWQYFTNWNLGLIAGYYTLALSATTFYVLHEFVFDKPPNTGSSVTSSSSSTCSNRSGVLRGAGTFLSVYFSIASVTALFVTTVNFVLLDPTPSFFNMTAHLFTSLSFLVDMSLNCIEVKLNEFVFNMSWILLWFAFIWPIVLLGVKPEWPYDFMDSSTPAVLLYFQVLFLLYFLIFYCWQAIGTAKLNRFSAYASSACTASSNRLLSASDMHLEQDFNDKAYESLTSEI
jgi:hypothetical protein